MKVLLLIALLVLVLSTWLSLRPATLEVELVPAALAPMRLLLEEEGRTRVANRHIITAPLAGQLERVELEPGDAVVAGDELFRLLPLPAAALDARTLAQAQALLERTEATLQQYQQQQEASQAQLELSQRELQRGEQLHAAGHLAAERLDQLHTAWRHADATAQSSRFATQAARHERDIALLQLSVQGGAALDTPIRIPAPLNGTILQRLRQSSGPVQSGEPILVIGDLQSLEIEVDVLSADAVRLRPGMRAELLRWGGEPLRASISRVEPTGFTKLSALGVEEQRVWVVLQLQSAHSDWLGLGDGYRVDVLFILEEHPELLQVPASSLFRLGEDWYLYVEKQGRAQLRQVVPGLHSELQSAIMQGLEAGERVVRHPGQHLRPDMRIRDR
ncbi:efflux RND transporter periplasmic adaptor subunit [Halopseudomonas yangmingensis]|uniref:HlyD family secretion protein n=1 Tax=Halopseudomonas yangmingensis TaxID=1720063 RepID=A0A1I4QLA5_9GAMM|nr:HlyD family efflux transporter periplasmic adaptor subunit [Halopseudomonas yangmingensis]SFM40465.1 HlyD family secretion protein [Halopseudomonas yangmingensis]